MAVDAILIQMSSMRLQQKVRQENLTFLGLVTIWVSQEQVTNKTFPDKKNQDHQGIQGGTGEDKN